VVFTAAIRRLNVHRLALALTGALLLSAISGCGAATPSNENATPVPVPAPTTAPEVPLAALTPEQREQLDAITVAMTNFGSLPEDGDFGQALALARAAEAICDRADQSQSLLAAYSAACAPTLRSVKLTQLLGQRCAQPGPACSKTLFNIAKVTRATGKTVVVINREVKAAVQNPACAKELSATADEVLSFKLIADAFDRMGEAAQAGDNAAFQAAAQELQQVTKEHPQADADKTPVELTKRFRAACQTTSSVKPINAPVHGQTA
jgi:hypothetical protein